MAPKPAQDLVRKLYGQGRSLEEIRRRLKEDGYSKSRISQLMAGWAPQPNQHRPFAKAREEGGLAEDRIQSQSDEDEDEDATKKKSKRRSRKSRKKRSHSVSSSSSPTPKRCCEKSDLAQPADTTSKDVGCLTKTETKMQ